MILEALLPMAGTAFGGLFRLAPELMKFFDRKNERSHELQMFDRQIEADKLKSAQVLAQIEAQHAQAIDTGDLQALLAATEAQGRPTGIPLADAISALMRPLLTFWWAIVLVTAAKVAQLVVALQAGIAPADAVLRLWTIDDQAIVASILSFWFVDRALRNSKGFLK